MTKDIMTDLKKNLLENYSKFDNSFKINYKI
jgi:hypothetical protein